MLLSGEELDEHPDASLKMYIGCTHWSTPDNRVIPWSGGWLDWDMQEVKEYEWLEALIKEEQANNDRREKAKLEAAKHFGVPQIRP